MKERLKKTQYLFLALFLIGATIAIGGCTIVGRKPRPMQRKKAVVSKAPAITLVYVKEAPPKIVAEKRPPKLHASAVWVAGHWNWNGARYAWVNGHWDKNPKGREWISGKWKKTPNGWLWEDGHWR